MKQESSLKFAGKLQDYKLLIKFNLSFMVVFSALISYLLAPKVMEYDWAAIGLFFIGGMLVTGSANAINQIVEKDTDAMMKRTAGRPVAAGRMSPGEAWTFAVLAGVGGVLILLHFNFLTAALAALSLFIYAFIYTPLKKVSSISVLVGAIPGSLPCLIGWLQGMTRSAPAAGSCSHFSSSGNSRISGRSRGSRTRIMRWRVSDSCHQTKVPQNTRPSSPLFTRCCWCRWGCCRI